MADSEGGFQLPDRIQLPKFKEQVERQVEVEQEDDGGAIEVGDGDGTTHSMIRNPTLDMLENMPDIREIFAAQPPLTTPGHDHMMRFKVTESQGDDSQPPHHPDSHTPP